MANRKESASDIVVSVDDETDITVERLTLTKEIDIEQIYGSNNTLPDGYAINQISYQGTMELQGNRLDLQELFFDSNGIPVEVEITITHFDDTTTTYSEVLATSEGWEMSDGESTTTTYEFMAMGKSHAGRTDTDPQQLEGDDEPSLAESIEDAQPFGQSDPDSIS